MSEALRFDSHPVTMALVRRALQRRSKNLRGRTVVGCTASCAQRSGGNDALQSTCRGVAQPGSASALGAEGRGFESLRPDQNYWARNFEGSLSEEVPCRFPANSL